MQQFFKDYKSKMLKEEVVKQQQAVNFQPEALNETNKGVFVKRKIPVDSQENSSKPSNGFMFNFKDPSEDQELLKVTKSVNSIKLS